MPVVAAAAPPTTAVFKKSRRPKFCSVMASSRSPAVHHRMTCVSAHSMRRSAAADKAARRVASLRWRRAEGGWNPTRRPERTSTRFSLKP
jgi:hypothetical protein